MNVVAVLKRCARETEDWLRYHPSVRALLSRCRHWGDRWHAPRDPQELARSIGRLCAAARLAREPATIAALQQQIHARISVLDQRRLDWTEFAPEIHHERIPRAAILKPCLDPDEKGIVFISHESEWVKLLQLGNLSDFAARYDLVIAPSSSPHNLINYAFAAAYPGAIFTLISNAGDATVLPSISSKLVVVPLYASNWVNPAWFTPKPKAERAFDLIMVANFAKVKRHHVLFRALRAMPRQLRVLLVGQDQDARTAASIEDEARWYDVRDRLTLRVNQPYASVIDAFCDSRASVILSRREGSCVVVAETMFADTPVAVLDNAELGSRAFINDQTGAFINEQDLAQQLTTFVQNADRYAPRQWAEANISCHVSSARLNGILKEQAHTRGHAWSLDLAPLQWCPDPQLVRAEDRAWMLAERQAIAERFGIVIGTERD